MKWEDWVLLIGLGIVVIGGGFVVQSIIYKIRDWWKGW